MAKCMNNATVLNTIDDINIDIKKTKKESFKSEVLRTCLTSKLKNLETVEQMIKLISCIIKTFTKSEISQHSMFKEYTSYLVAAWKPDKNRILEFIVNFSQKENSKVMGCTVNTVKIITVLVNSIEETSKAVQSTENVSRDLQYLEMHHKINSANEVKIDKEIDDAYIFLDYNCIKIQNKDEIVVVRHSSIIKFEVDGLALRFFATKNKIVEMKFAYNQNVDKFVERLNLSLYTFETHESIDINIESNIGKEEKREQKLFNLSECNNVNAFQKVTFKSDYKHYDNYTHGLDSQKNLEKIDGYKIHGYAHACDNNVSEVFKRDLKCSKKRILKNSKSRKKNIPLLRKHVEGESDYANFNKKDITGKNKGLESLKASESKSIENSNAYERVIKSSIDKSEIDLLGNNTTQAYSTYQIAKFNQCYSILDETKRKTEFSLSLGSIDNSTFFKQENKTDDDLTLNKVNQKCLADTDVSQEKKTINVEKTSRHPALETEFSTSKEIVCNNLINSLTDIESAFSSSYSMLTPEKSFKNKSREDKCLKVTKRKGKSKKNKSSVLVYKSKRKSVENRRFVLKKRLILESSVIKKINDLYKQKMKLLELKQDKRIRLLKRSKGKMLKLAHKTMLILSN